MHTSCLFAEDSLQTDEDAEIMLLKYIDGDLESNIRGPLRKKMHCHRPGNHCRGSRPRHGKDSASGTSFLCTLLYLLLFPAVTPADGYKFENGGRAGNEYCCHGSGQHIREFRSSCNQWHVFIGYVCGTTLLYPTTLERYDPQ